MPSGTATAPGTGRWHTLTLGFSGSSITAKLDSTTLTKVTDTSYASGQVGFGLVGYHTDQFAAIKRGKQQRIDRPGASASNRQGPLVRIENLGLIHLRQQLLPRRLGRLSISPGHG